jgi:hypothetical protein
MKRKLVISCCLAVLCTVGCSSTASTKPSDYVGEYIFTPFNTVPGDFASVVILKGDQTAIEFRFARNTGQVQTTQKKWYLSHTTGENVVIGNFSHPVEGSRPIKLGINGDLGQYYEKVR